MQCGALWTSCCEPLIDTTVTELLSCMIPVFPSSEPPNHLSVGLSRVLLPFTYKRRRQWRFSA
jgi:hypothetical protein